MASKPSDQAERIIGLRPGKSCVVPRNPYGLLITARRYTVEQARFSVYRAEGHYVVTRTA